MKRVAIIVMIMVLMATLGLFNLNVPSAAASADHHMPSYSALPPSHIILEATSLPETIIGSRSLSVGMFSVNHHHPPSNRMSVQFPKTTFARTGIRQVILARIRD
jgi:hypothetical protein